MGFLKWFGLGCLVAAAMMSISAFVDWLEYDAPYWLESAIKMILSFIAVSGVLGFVSWIILG